MKTWTECIIEAKQKYQDGYLALNVYSLDKENYLGDLTFEVVMFPLNMAVSKYIIIMWHNYNCFFNFMLVRRYIRIFL